MSLNDINCSAQTVTVSDNDGIASVTVNDVAVVLANNQFTLSPATGTQEIIATDNAGNSKTVTVTVNSNHNLKKISAKAATVTETGNKEYWHCKDCKKYFSDAAGTNEIKLDDTIISKLSPEIIEGKGQSITAGDKKELTFKSNAAFSDFIRVELDGKPLMKRIIERSFGFSLFSCPFSVYSGTFDYQTAFEYNYGRKSKEVTIWANS